MIKPKQLKILALIGIFLIISLACAFLPDEATPQPATYVPPSNEVVSYLVPAYGIGLAPSERVPGTQMAYIGTRDNGYEVSIDGLRVIKQPGDSFFWKGIISPGVVGRYDLRISSTFLGNDLQVIGPVELTVLNPKPVELDNANIPTEGMYHFNNIAINYNIPKGGQVPGTTLIFDGRTEQGAQLSGTTGYPYRALGDSLIWNGRLRGNVSTRYNLRVTNISEDSLSLVGLAELWVKPAR
jgi:hypothetical protein